MAKTFSSMIALGTQAPEFSLVDVVSKQIVSFNHHQKTIATVIAFICNHCPYVKHINHELTHLAREYMKKDVRFIAINANDIEHYPDDSPDNMRSTAKEQDYPFPYLFDETQEVARAYHAECTPDFYVFDQDRLLVYRGQFDESRPGNHIKTNGNSIRLALECLLANTQVPEIQKPSIGCNIKWKK